MSSFQFNFFKSATETESDSLKKISSKHENGQDENTDSVVPCTQWIPNHMEDCKFSSEAVEGPSGMVKRSFSEIQAISTDVSTISEVEKSDLVPKKYEGGLKTWECSIDLLNFFYEISLSGQGEIFKNVKDGHVLEVGCGSGLPGIFCLSRCSAKKVVFQDYNQSVLEIVTLPNILLNRNQTDKADADADADLLSRCSFYYGDWNGLPDILVPSNSFDLIITSETIYRTESYPLLLAIFSKALKNSSEAAVILAAKDYYFGLGGSITQFSLYAQANGWSVQTLKHFIEGVPRSILKLIRK